MNSPIRSSQRPHFWLRALAVLLAAATFATAAPPALRAGPKKTAKKQKFPPVRGVAFHFCSCALPCSCMFTDKEAEGCTIVRVYHVTDGGYAGPQIKGKTLVEIPLPEKLRKLPDAPTSSQGEAVNLVRFVDEDLDADGRAALVSSILEMNVVSGMGISTMRPARIIFRQTKDGYEIEIPGLLHGIAEHARGADKKPMTADNLDLAEGSKWFLGKAKIHTFQDAKLPDWKWDFSGKNASWTFFEAQAHVDPGDR